MNSNRQNEVEELLDELDIIKAYYVWGSLNEIRARKQAAPIIDRLNGIRRYYAILCETEYKPITFEKFMNGSY